jgi:hypothetical protein
VILCRYKNINKVPVLIKGGMFVLTLLLFIGGGIVTLNVLDFTVGLNAIIIDIVVFVDLFLLAESASFLKRKTKKIVIKYKKLNNKDSELENDEVLFFMDAFNILNSFAELFTVLYILFTAILLFMIIILPEYTLLLILMGIILLIDILLFVACYSSTKNIKESFIVMQYIEASIVKVMYILCIIFFLILFQLALAVIFLFVFIMCFFG